MSHNSKRITRSQAKLRNQYEEPNTKSMPEDPNTKSLPKAAIPEEGSNSTASKYTANHGKKHKNNDENIQHKKPKLTENTENIYLSSKSFYRQNPTSASRSKVTINDHSTICFNFGSQTINQYPQNTISTVPSAATDKIIDMHANEDVHEEPDYDPLVSLFPSGNNDDVENALSDVLSIVQEDNHDQPYLSEEEEELDDEGIYQNTEPVTTCSQRCLTLRSVRQSQANRKLWQVNTVRSKQYNKGSTLLQLYEANGENEEEACLKAIDNAMIQYPSFINTRKRKDSKKCTLCQNNDNGHKMETYGCIMECNSQACKETSKKRFLNTASNGFLDNNDYSESEPDYQSFDPPTYNGVNLNDVFYEQQNGEKISYLTSSGKVRVPKRCNAQMLIWKCCKTKNAGLFQLKTHIGTQQKSSPKKKSVK
jgi:hypothetical protein